MVYCVYAASSVFGQGALARGRSFPGADRHVIGSRVLRSGGKRKGNPRRTLYQQRGSMLLLHSLFAALVLANTEKAVFLGPKAVTVPDVQPSLEALHLETLSPGYSSIRTQLPRAFPTDGEPRGLQSWYLLDHLDDGTRYEVRLCWPASVCLATLTGHASLCCANVRVAYTTSSNRPHSGSKFIACSILSMRPT